MMSTKDSYAMRLFTVVIIFVLGVCGVCAQSADSVSPAVKAPSKPSVRSPEYLAHNLLFTLNAFLPDTVVLKVGSEELRWEVVQSQVMDLVSGMLAKVNRRGNQTPSDKELVKIRKKIQEFFAHIAQQQLFLMEVNERKIELSGEDRARITNELKRSLARMPTNKMDGKPMTVEEFRQSFPAETTFMGVNFEDSMRLVRFSEILFEKNPIPAEAVERKRQMYASVNERIGAFMDSTRANLKKLVDDNWGELNTDEGFAKFAKKYSAGEEKKNKGILPFEFTREQLAIFTETEKFDYKVGETTRVIETSTCFRVIRVLKEVPPAKAGEPVRYVVAQIVAPKNELRDLSDEMLLAEMTPVWQNLILRCKAMELSEKFHVQSILFPEGLFDPLDPKQFIFTKSDSGQGNGAQKETQGMGNAGTAGQNVYVPVKN